MAVDSLYRAMIDTLVDTLVTYGDVVKTQGDYAQYCLEKEPNKPLSDTHLSTFEKENLIAYEKSRLEIKYEDFRYLMNEYHDGLLLFEISNDLVWGKASEDTEGLQKFYKKNKKNYIFKDSCQQADLMYFKDSSVYTTYLSLKDSMELAAIKDSLNQNGINLKTSEGYYKVGDDAVVDALGFGKTDDGIYDDFKVINIEGQRYEAGDIKPLDATRGTCISDYQNYLEKRWIKKLRRKHRIKINKDILNQLQ